MFTTLYIIFSDVQGQITLVLVIIIIIIIMTLFKEDTQLDIANLP